MKSLEQRNTDLDNTIVAVNAADYTRRKVVNTFFVIIIVLMMAGSIFFYILMLHQTQILNTHMNCLVSLFSKHDRQQLVLTDLENCKLNSN